MYYWYTCGGFYNSYSSSGLCYYNGPKEQSTTIDKDDASGESGNDENGKHRKIIFDPDRREVT